MNTHTQRTMTLPAGRGAAVASDPRWRVALPLVIAAILALLAIHWTTVESIVAIWVRSETFAHGFLIVPIVIVLIWQRRQDAGGAHAHARLRWACCCSPAPARFGSSPMPARSWS